LIFRSTKKTTPLFIGFKFFLYCKWRLTKMTEELETQETKPAETSEVETKPEEKKVDESSEKAEQAE